MASDFGRLKSMIRASFSVKMLSGLTDTEAEIADFPLLQISIKIGPISDAQILKISSLDLQVTAMKIQKICRERTGVFDPMI